jgi:inositol transport system permease protein
MEKPTDNKLITQARKHAFNKFINKYGIFLILILMIVGFGLLNNVFFKPSNLINIVRQMSIIGLLAIGVTIVIITTGIDLSLGSVLALSAVVASGFAQSLDFFTANSMDPFFVQRFGFSISQYPVVVPVLAGLAVGTLCGFINGLIIAKTKIPPFIATLGMMTSARGLALLYADGRPISNLTENYKVIGQGLLFEDALSPGIPIPIVILFVMAIIASILLKHTKFGKYVYAIGGNENAAVVSGINIDKYKIMIYTFAGFLAGLAGIVLSSRISSGQPGLGVSYELDAIASAVIGGTSLSGGIGSIPGTIVGAMIMGVLKNGLDLLNVSAYWQQIIKGAIIVVAVVLDQSKNRKK